LPALLAAAGFTVRFAAPKIFCVSPADPVWQWPASFISVNLQRLQELGRVDEAWVATVQHEFTAAESRAGSLMLTPMVLEIIAERNARNDQTVERPDAPPPVPAAAGRPSS
jgi:hypothetical protein